MNKKYWDHYYANNLGIQTPTSFANHVVPLIKKGESILELGCGNGRDSFHFANKGFQVYAVDQSQIVINQIKKENINPKFICENIENIQKKITDPINHCYARFFFHALNENEEDQAIKSISKLLPKNGLFFSENRSVKSDLYGKGQIVSKDIFSTDHKRRFIRKNNLISKLKKNDFEIKSIVETNGIAIYKDDDPIVIRICARKLSNI